MRHQLVQERPNEHPQECPPNTHPSSRTRPRGARRWLLLCSCRCLLRCNSKDSREVGPPVRRRRRGRSDGPTSRSVGWEYVHITSTITAASRLPAFFLMRKPLAQSLRSRQPSPFMSTLGPRSSESWPTTAAATSQRPSQLYAATLVSSTSAPNIYGWNQRQDGTLHQTAICEWDLCTRLRPASLAS